MLENKIRGLPESFNFASSCVYLLTSISTDTTTGSRTLVNDGLRLEDGGHAWLTKTIGINGQSRVDVYPCVAPCESASATFFIIQVISLRELCQQRSSVLQQCIFIKRERDNCGVISSC
ncbi:hypothetical protein ACS0PU_006848 [Formica fusca]